MKMIELPSRGGDRDGQLVRLAKDLEAIGDTIGFKVSARGWCYLLEQFGLITKAQFDRVEVAINGCRTKGFLAIDFTAEEEARKFSGIEEPTPEEPVEYMRGFLEATLMCEDYYTPDWWEGEGYYIQMVVEKIDLKTLFSPICERFHIPIATTKGWSSMLQRAEYARRFKTAEGRGLRCVLLYCGDHDPDGLRISDFLRSNLHDLSYIRWNDGSEGYNPTHLEVNRFGLNADFIEEHGLTWIDNLITTSGKDLASPSHPNYYLPYVQDYLGNYGAKKCEANVLVVIPKEARLFVRQVIENYLGQDAEARFTTKKQEVIDEVREFREETGVDSAIRKAIKIIDER